MKSTTQLQEDGSTLLTVKYKGVTETRSIPPFLTEDDQLDEEKVKERVKDLCTSIKEKIDLGMITPSTNLWVEGSPANTPDPKD